MKITHAIYDSIDNPWLGGGGATRTHEIYKRLAKTNEVKVITGNFKNANAVIDNVKYLRIGIGNTYAISRLSYHLMAPFYLFLIKSDISIEDMGMPIPFFITKLKKKYLCSVQFIPKDSYIEKRKMAGKILIKIFKLGIKHYKSFTTVSEYAKKEILKINPKAKVSVLRNGINIPHNIKPSKGHMLYIGRIDINQKGLDTLLLAAQILQKEHILTPLIIAGGGEKKEVDALKSLISKYHLDNMVTYIGIVQDNKKREVLESASFVVFPSRNETFGIVAIEALSYGKAVIGGDTGGLADIINTSGGGLLFKPGDYEELASTMRLLLQNPSRADELSVAAKDYVKSLQWENIAYEYLQILEDRINE
jgi:glycogen(starch) synthase